MVLYNKEMDDIVFECRCTIKELLLLLLLLSGARTTCVSQSKATDNSHVHTDGFDRQKWNSVKF